MQQVCKCIFCCDFIICCLDICVLNCVVIKQKIRTDFFLIFIFEKLNDGGIRQTTQ